MRFLILLIFFSHYSFADLSRQEKFEILTEHNKVRAQYNVHNVYNLQWSDKLTSFAKVWANYLSNDNNCTMRHRPRNGKYQQKYGENIFWSSPLKWSNGLIEVNKVKPKEVVKAWASEVEYYDYQSNTCQTGKMCGHYTQVIWHSSRYLGCAKAICPSKGQIWVCNYDPPGNYIGQKPY